MSAGGSPLTEPMAFSPGAALDTATDHASRQVVALAGRAPSVHNTQPWAWRLGPGWLELHADRRRQLRHADPTGRNLVISCGAALHHAVVAARGLGLAAVVQRLPDGDDSDLLARVSLTPGSRGPEEVAELLALGSRHTDRRRYTSWPVPAAKLVQLVETAERWGAHAISVQDPDARWRIDTLSGRARHRQSSDVDIRREHQEWLDRSAVDGVPHALIPPPSDLAGAHEPRFSSGSLDQGASDVDHDAVPGDGVIVLGGPADDPASWLAVGLGLSALWLRAEQSRLSVVPLTQLVEVEETRQSLALDVLDGLTVPHLVLRLGWQPTSRRQLERTPRRPLKDVLRS